MKLKLKFTEYVERGAKPPFHSCTHCGKPLNHMIAWLELSTHTGKYTQDGLKESESQGWFPFGPSCAEDIISK